MNLVIKNKIAKVSSNDRFHSRGWEMESQKSINIYKIVENYLILINNSYPEYPKQVSNCRPQV